MSGVEIGDAHAVVAGNDGDYRGFAEHAFFVFGQQNFDELVGDAAEAAGENHALAVVAGDHALQGGERHKRGGVFSGGAPVGGAVAVPPLLDFRSVAAGEIG